MLQFLHLRKKSYQIMISFSENDNNLHFSFLEQHQGSIFSDYESVTILSFNIFTLFYLNLHEFHILSNYIGLTDESRVFPNFVVSVDICWGSTEMKLNFKLNDF